MKESKLLRAKTLDLRLTRPLTEKRQANSKKNEEEALAGKLVLESMPRRFVFELTNACNLNCKMCGRNSAQFQPTWFQMEWLKYFEPVAPQVEEVTLMGWGLFYHKARRITTFVRYIFQKQNPLTPSSPNRRRTHTHRPPR